MSISFSSFLSLLVLSFSLYLSFLHFRSFFFTGFQFPLFITGYCLFEHARPQRFCLFLGNMLNCATNENFLVYAATDIVIVVVVVLVAVAVVVYFILCGFYYCLLCCCPLPGLVSVCVYLCVSCLCFIKFFVIVRVLRSCNCSWLHRRTHEHTHTHTHTHALCH